MFGYSSVNPPETTGTAVDYQNKISQNKMRRADTLRTTPRSKGSCIREQARPDFHRTVVVNGDLSYRFFHAAQRLVLCSLVDGALKSALVNRKTVRARNRFDGITAPKKTGEPEKRSPVIIGKKKPETRKWAAPESPVSSV
jgi:hypothetical protein